MMLATLAALALQAAAAVGVPGRARAGPRPWSLRDRHDGRISFYRKGGVPDDRGRRRESPRRRHWLTWEASVSHEQLKPAYYALQALWGSW